jgi:hypothetical protein
VSIVVETLMGQDLELGTSTTSKTHPGGGTLSGHQISLSTFSTVGAAGSATTATWDPGNIVSGGSASTTVTVTGAALGDFAIASFSLDLQGMVAHAYVSAADTVTVVLNNLSGGALNLASGTLKILAFKTR